MKQPKIYHADWEDSKAKGVANDFQIELEKGIKILFAVYTYEDYSGSAFVLFKKGRSLYEVNGSHCSCYGLEGQWEPELTSIAALQARIKKGNVVYCGWGDSNIYDKELAKTLQWLKETK